MASKPVVAFDDYMEYALNMKNMFAAVPEAKTAASSSVDGKVYRYPGVHPKEYATDGYPTFINKSWLDKLGLKIPTTTDEFKSVLEAFRDNDCNGNGDKNDEIPLLTTQSWFGYWFKMIMGSWDLLEFKSTDKYATCTIRDGKLDFNPVNLNYRKALEYFHELYKEGLMSKDYMTADDNSRKARSRVNPSVTGVGFGWSLQEFIAADNLDKYVVMPALKGPDGVKQYYRDFAYGITDGLVIFKGCKCPEILVRWIDYLNDGINPYRLYLGMEGENSWHIDNDKKRFVLSEQYAQNPDLQVNEGIQNPPGCRDPRYTGIEDIRQQKIELGKVYEKDLNKDTWLNTWPIMSSTPETKEIGLLLTDLSADCQSFMVDAVTNGIDDDKWNKHIKKCEQLEYKETVSYWQRIYDDAIKLSAK